MQQNKLPLNRREFLKALGLTGVGLLASGLLTNCKQTSETSPPTAPPATATAPATATPGATSTPSPTATAIAPPTATPESEALRIRRRMASDHLRPLYHFLAPHNWMNDPHGVIQWQGQYHLFYQHNPDAAYWANMHWGHAVSDDLVYWRDLPIALAPSLDGPDQNGCWSGSAVINNGTPTIFYTGAEYTVPVEEYRGGPQAIQTVCLATSNDGMLTWEKDPHNPINVEPPPDLNLSPEGFRDPYVWREDDHWCMAIGTGIVGQGGAVLLYRSPDLVNLIDWQYLGPLFASSNYGYFYVCPSFFPLDNKHILVFGQQNTGLSRYVVGTYADHQFTPEQIGLLDAGRVYAPQVMIDEQGRRLLFSWIWEGGWRGILDVDDAASRAGWAGISPMPRILSLQADNTVVAAPIPELSALRGERVHLEDLELAAGEEQTLPVEGNCLELLAELDVSRATSGGLKLCCSADDEEKTTLVYDRSNRSLTLSVVPAGREGAQRSITTAELLLAEGENLRLHAFVDRSIIEVFANERRCLTTRLYPGPESQGVRLLANGGPVSLKSLEAWQMNPIWPTG